MSQVYEDIIKKVSCFGHFCSDRICGICYLSNEELYEECKKHNAIIYFIKKDINNCCHSFVSSIDNTYYEYGVALCNKDKSRCNPSAKCLDSFKTASELMQKVEEYINHEKNN